MTSPYLIADLERDEGFREHAYPDPLSGGEPWTVGFGFTGKDIGPETTIALAAAKTELAKRVGALTKALRARLPWFASLTDLRQDCLCNMAYQLGLDGLMTFHRTLADIEAGRYVSASIDMLQSAWAHQTPKRARRIALQMRTGVHQP